MTVNGHERGLIEKIAQKSGLSVSSVYKILVNPFEFSQSTAEKVKALALLYGLRAREQNTSGRINIGVIIPCRPSYFWREASEGMKKAQRLWSAEYSAQASLIFSYYQNPITPEVIENLYAPQMNPECDGYIVYPVDDRRCAEFIKIKSETSPVVIFNESRRRFASIIPEDGGERIAFTGADNVDEGEKAAMIIESKLSSIRHIVCVLTSDSEHSEAVKLRIGSFCGAVKKKRGDITFDIIGLEVCSKITSAFLSRRLYDIHKIKPVDCVYMSSGVTHIACAAIEKIRRRCGRDSIGAVCVGHELSPSDRRWLLDGTQKGYVRQDVFAQGYQAVDSLMKYLTLSLPMSDCYFKSHVFIGASEKGDSYTVIPGGTSGI